MGHDRRTAGRYECRLSCRILERSGGRGFIEHDAVVTEIGDGGVFVSTTRRPVEGERIGLVIRDPKEDGSELRFFGIVAHRTDLDAAQVGFGVEFETATARDRERLESIVEVMRSKIKAGGFRAAQAEEANRATFNRPSVDVDEADSARLIKTVKGKKMSY